MFFNWTLFTIFWFLLWFFLYVWLILWVFGNVILFNFNKINWHFCKCIMRVTCTLIGYIILCTKVILTFIFLLHFWVLIVINLLQSMIISNFFFSIKDILKRNNFLFIYEHHIFTLLNCICKLLLRPFSILLYFILKVYFLFVFFMLFYHF